MRDSLVSNSYFILRRQNAFRKEYLKLVSKKAIFKLKSNMVVVVLLTTLGQLQAQRTEDNSVLQIYSPVPIGN